MLTNRKDAAVAFANTEQAEFWSQIAPTWIELEDRMEEAGGLPGQLAMDRLDLRPGQRVVDLGLSVGNAFNLHRPCGGGRDLNAAKRSLHRSRAF